MLHVTYDVIGIAQYHFFKSKMAAMYFALYRNFKHGASLYLKFEDLNLSVVIIFKTFHWLKNFESCSVVSVARCQCCFASEK